MKKGVLIIISFVFLVISFSIFYKYRGSKQTGIYSGKVEKHGDCNRTFIEIKLDNYPTTSFVISGLNTNYNIDLREFCEIIQSHDSIPINFDTQEILITENGKQLSWDLDDLSYIKN